MNKYYILMKGDSQVGEFIGVYSSKAKVLQEIGIMQYVSTDKERYCIIESEINSGDRVILDYTDLF